MLARLPLGTPDRQLYLRCAHEPARASFQGHRGGLKMPQAFENLDPPYTWTQTLSDVDVFIRLPPGTSTRTVAVSLRPDTVKVEIKGSVALEVRCLLEVYYQGTLFNKINPSDSTWTLGKHPCAYVRVLCR